MPTQLSKSKATEVLQKALDEIPVVKETGSIGSQDFKKWQRNTRVALRYVFGEASSQIRDFRQISYTPPPGVLGLTGDYYRRRFDSGMDDANAALQSMLNEVKTSGKTTVQKLLWRQPKFKSAPTSMTKSSWFTAETQERKTALLGFWRI